MLDNNVYKNQKTMQFQAMTPQQNQQAVPMQAINPELLKGDIQDTYVANRVSETTDDPKGMLYTGMIAVPAWFAITQGMDAYAKRCRGNFEDTILYKVTNAGDKWTNQFKNSSVGQSDFFNSINNGIKNLKTFVKDKIVGKSRILRAFAYTPSKPELDMVKGNANGMWGMQLFDYPQHGETFCSSLKAVEDLDCYGATKEEIANFKNLYKNASTPEARAKILQEAELKTILKNSRKGLTPAQIANEISAFNALDAAGKVTKLKDLKAIEWGYKSFADMEAILKSAQDNMPKILEACNDANPKMFARIWGSNASEFGKVKTKLIGREVYAKETANKLLAELGNIDLKQHPELERVLKDKGLISKLPKSALGKFFGKYSNLVLEGATNRVAGGKAVAIFQAAYLADVIYKSMKQEGGISEKGKSFAERFTEMIAFFICMPFAVQLMHKIGGLQYAGMTKEQVEAYRKALKAHNEKAMAGGFQGKSAWKTSRNNLRKMLKADVKNPITNLFKCAGRIVSVGLEQIRPYDKKSIGVLNKETGKMEFRQGIGQKLKDLWHHPKFGMKQMAGYPMRIVLGMFILLPFFSKLAVKGSHLIFGKPKHSVLDEGKEEEKSQQTSQLPPQLQQQLAQQQIAQQQMQQNVIQQVQSTTTTQNMAQSPTNLLNKYRNGQTTTTTTTTTVNNSQQKSNEPVRTYIPSPMGVKLTNGEDLTAAEKALRRADIAEQQALQTLKMN